MRIRSISPRAFISGPMPGASRFEMPVARAASQQATPLPEPANDSAGARAGAVVGGLGIAIPA